MFSYFRNFVPKSDQKPKMGWTKYLFSSNNWGVTRIFRKKMNEWTLWWISNIFNFEKQQLNWSEKNASHCYFRHFLKRNRGLKLTYQPRLHRRLFGHLFAQASMPHYKVLLHIRSKLIILFLNDKGRKIAICHIFNSPKNKIINSAWLCHVGFKWVEIKNKGNSVQ